MKYPDDLRAALLTVTDKVTQFVGLKNTDKYIVFAEDSRNDTHADGTPISKIISGTIDYFTKSYNDPKAEEIEAVIESLGIPYDFNSLQYEEDTGFYHHEWVFEWLK